MMEPEILKENISTAIRMLMNLEKISQSDLAASLDITDAHISLIINKKRMPGLELSIKIAEHFKIGLAPLTGYGRDPIKRVGDLSDREKRTILKAKIAILIEQY